MSKEKIVCVDWEDAAYNSGSYDAKAPEDFEVILNKTVGHIVKSERGKVIVATDKWFESGSGIRYRHISTIPRGMIKKITYLRSE